MNGKIDVLEQTEHGKVTEGDFARRFLRRNPRNHSEPISN